MPINQTGDRVGNRPCSRTAGNKIGEHHDCKTVIGIASNPGGKTLPASTVLNALVLVLLTDHPAKSITSVIRLTVIEEIHGPNAI